LKKSNTPDSGTGTDTSSKTPGNPQDTDRRKLISARNTPVVTKRKRPKTRIKLSSQGVRATMEENGTPKSLQ
jgi:hypothetical protein